jgi:hypothetical protein
MVLTDPSYFGHVDITRPLEHLCTTSVKPAAGRPVKGAWHLALDSHQVFTFSLANTGDGVQQIDGVRMPGIFERDLKPFHGQQVITDIQPFLQASCG